MKRMKKAGVRAVLLSAIMIICIAGSAPLKVRASEDKRITIMAVGDNLYHMGLVESGKNKDGHLDYSFEFETIRPFLDQADIKIINQETVFGGDDLGFSGFPRFNCPEAVGDAIADAGFNVVLHATNHSNDQGVKGLIHCVDYMNTNYPQILTTGAWGTREKEADEIPLLKIKGYTFAILNYTYSVNQETYPKNLEGHLNLLCAYDKSSRMVNFSVLNQKVLEDIALAEEAADFTIVCPHWGNEYQTSASRVQQKFAKQMVEAGADLIIGAHPHVVQQVEEVCADNGNKALCYYSLGNYISTQKKARTMYEALAYITLEIDNGKLVIDEEKTGAIPMVMQYRTNPTRFEHLYLLEQYSAKKASQSGVNVYDTLKFSDLHKWSKETLGRWIRCSSQVLISDKDKKENTQ